MRVRSCELRHASLLNLLVHPLNLQRECALHLRAELVHLSGIGRLLSCVRHIAIVRRCRQYRIGESRVAQTKLARLNSGSVTYRSPSKMQNHTY